ncbi:MAG: hypothetical protein ACYC0T_14395 [Ramlibacter sp.]
MWLIALLSLAAVAVGMALWWPAPPGADPVKVLAPAATAPVSAAPPVSLPPPLEEPPEAALPVIQVPADTKGKDPLTAAVQGARERPQPPPPPGVATAKTLEEAFAAMRAARAGAPQAGVSPFGSR